LVLFFKKERISCFLISIFMHLLTWHGTVVCRADASGPLRHLPIPLPPGATPVRLAAATLSPGQIVTHSDLGTFLVSRGAHGATITLKRDADFMCADMPSRRVTFDRAEPGGWETFLPISQEDLRDLRHILQHYWIIRQTRQVMRRGTVCLQEPITLRIGTMLVDLANLTQPIVTVRDGEGLPLRLSVSRGDAHVELAIAGPRDSEWIRPEDGANAARQAAEVIALALHRNISGQEPEQHIFERHAALLQSKGVVAGIEAVLDQLVPPPPPEHTERQAAPVFEPPPDPASQLQRDVAQFGHVLPALSVSPRDLGYSDEILRTANASLRRFADAAGLRTAVAFGTYDRAGAGLGGEVCVLDIEDRAIKFRLPDDTPPSWLLMHRSLGLMYQIDAMFNAGIPAHGRFLTELGDGGHLESIAYCSSARKVCLVPDCDFISSNGYQDFRALAEVKGIPWPARAPKIFWRGSTTGGRRKPPPSRAENDDFTWLPRLDLCRRVRDSALAAHYDVGISNIAQIDEPDLVDRIRRAGLLKPPVPREAFLGHKALIVIDGNSNAWSALFCALLTGACVLLVKSPQGYRQWYHDRLQPWLHYVPVCEDLRDLDRVARWVLDNDDDARAIGEAGQVFANALTFDTALADGIARLAAWFSTPRT
jgi:hypothetical protein